MFRIIPQANYHRDFLGFYPFRRTERIHGQVVVVMEIFKWHDHEDIIICAGT